MKRSNKLCFGLLSVLFTISVLSLFGFSDVSALKYSIDTIPFGDSYLYPRKFTDVNGNIQYGYFSKSNNLDIVTDPDHPFPNGFRFPHTWRFSGRYNSELNTCELSDYSDGLDTLDYADGYSGYIINSLTRPTLSSSMFFSDESPFNLNNSLSSGNNSWFLNSHSNTSGYFPSALCSIDNFSYSDIGEDYAPIDSNMPHWNWRSLINIPLVNERFAYEHSKPYYYNFNGLFLRGSQKVDGVVYQTNGLKSSDLFGVGGVSFSSLSMSLNPFYDTTSRIDLEDSPEPTGFVKEFDIVGSIEFESDYSMGSSPMRMQVKNFEPVDFNSSSYEFYDTLSDGSRFYYLNYLDTAESHASVCSLTDYHTSNGDDSNRIDFKCHYNPSDYYLNPNVDFRFLDISLLFGSSLGSGSPFFTTNGDYSFKDFNVVTNNDDTYISWSSTGSYVSGGDLSEAPGYGVGGGGSDGSSDVNWFESLASMFQFDFINPFGPIYDMFNSGESCASIPTIASMIHSNETQVCPWFSSGVRSIVTPVIGLSSMMLIFGFAVRWLKSSSGNLFEDSASEDIANVGGSGFRRFKK